MYHCPGRERAVSGKRERERERGNGCVGGGSGFSIYSAPSAVSACLGRLLMGPYLTEEEWVGTYICIYMDVGWKVIVVVCGEDLFMEVRRGFRHIRFENE